MQADGEEDEAYLWPVAMYDDPFEGKPHKLVLCEVRSKTGDPANASNRAYCEEVMEKASALSPWITYEQEYFIFDCKTNKPIGWPSHGHPQLMGPSYCGVGGGRENGRDVARAHYRACRNAGIKLSGLNAELVWGQWEYQCGPSEGITAPDDLWMSRYILERVAADFGVKISFDPKPIHSYVVGSGMHTNFSTTETRVAPSGVDSMIKYINRLKLSHDEDVKVYDAAGGEDNRVRLSGRFIDTQNVKEFTYGVAKRNVSVRIPYFCNQNKCGYFEDRRPASNADPYLVTAALTKSALAL